MIGLRTLRRTTWAGVSQFEGESVDGKPVHVRCRHGQLLAKVGGDVVFDEAFGNRNEFVVEWPDIERLIGMRFEPALRLRPAAPADMDEVALLNRFVRDVAFPNMPKLHGPDDDRAYFRNVVFRDCAVWVAETDRIVGFCAHRPGWVDHLYVDPAMQGVGVGDALLARALDGQREVRLWAFQSNARALGFYARRGFAEERRTDGSGNEEGEPDVLMRWTRTTGA